MSRVVQLCGSGSVGYSRCSRTLTALVRLMGSEASAGGATATISSSLASTGNTGAPVGVASPSCTRLGDRHLARLARTASFDVPRGGLGGTWAGTGLAWNLGSQACRTEGGWQAWLVSGSRSGVVADGAVGSTIDTAMCVQEALQCDSVRRKRKKKMNKHKHSKRLRANKHKR